MRPRPAVTQDPAPRPIEDVVEYEHGHITAHAIAMRGDDSQLRGHRPPRIGVEVVELRHIAPRRQAGVTTARDDGFADNAEIGWSGAQVVFASLYVSL
jgi:hypothetical protein